MLLMKYGKVSFSLRISHSFFYIFPRRVFSSSVFCYFPLTFFLFLFTFRSYCFLYQNLLLISAANILFHSSFILDVLSPDLCMAKVSLAFCLTFDHYYFLHLITFLLMQHFLRCLVHSLSRKIYMIKLSPLLSMKFWRVSIVLYLLMDRLEQEKLIQWKVQERDHRY